jgi:hypothetical protein
MTPEAQEVLGACDERAVSDPARVVDAANLVDAVEEQRARRRDGSAEVVGALGDRRAPETESRQERREATVRVE